MEVYRAQITMERVPAGLPLERQNLEEADGIIEGYLSTYGTMVQTWIPTRILDGAWNKSIQEKQPKDVPLLWAHQTEEPIGVLTAWRNSSIGLWIKAQLTMSVQRAREVFDLVKSGAVMGLSVGFDVISYKIVREELDGVMVDVRHVSEGRIWEGSPVVFGADPKARITDVYARARTPYNGHRTYTNRLEELRAASAQYGDMIVRQRQRRNASYTPRARPPKLSEQQRRWLDEYAQELQQAAATGRLNADGSIRPVSVGHGSYLSQLMRRIEAIKQAEASLRETQLYEAKAQAQSTAYTSFMKHTPRE